MSLYFSVGLCLVYSREWLVNLKLNRNRKFLRLPKPNFFKLADNFTRPHVKIDLNKRQFTDNHTMTDYLSRPKLNFCDLYDWPNRNCNFGNQPIIPSLAYRRCQWFIYNSFITPKVHWIFLKPWRDIKNGKYILPTYFYSISFFGSLVT